MPFPRNIRGHNGPAPSVGEELERQREQVYLEQQWQNLFQVPTDEIEKQKSKCNTKRKAKVKGMIPLDGDV